jgi:hypothetical protein
VGLSASTGCRVVRARRRHPGRPSTTDSSS